MNVNRGPLAHRAWPFAEPPSPSHPTAQRLRNDVLLVAKSGLRKSNFSVATTRDNVTVTDQRVCAGVNGPHGLTCPRCRACRNPCRSWEDRRSRADLSENQRGGALRQPVGVPTRAVVSFGVGGRHALRHNQHTKGDQRPWPRQCEWPSNPPRCHHAHSLGGLHETCAIPPPPSTKSSGDPHSGGVSRLLRGTTNDLQASIEPLLAPCL